MHISAKLRTAFGPASIGSTPLVRVPLTRSELHQLAVLVERDAEQAEHDGCFEIAQTLAWRAAALREAGRAR